MPRVRLVCPAWHEVDVPHRCSQPYCLRPAVLYRADVVGRWSSRAPHRRVRHVCAVHASLYRLVRERGRWWFDLGSFGDDDYAPWLGGVRSWARNWITSR